MFDIEHLLQSVSTGNIQATITTETMTNNFKQLQICVGAPFCFEKSIVRGAFSHRDDQVVTWYVRDADVVKEEVGTFGGKVGGNAGVQVVIVEDRIRWVFRHINWFFQLLRLRFCNFHGRFFRLFLEFHVFLHFWRSFCLFPAPDVPMFAVFVDRFHAEVVNFLCGLLLQTRRFRASISARSFSLFVIVIAVRTEQQLTVSSGFLGRLRRRWWTFVIISREFPL